MTDCEACGRPTDDPVMVRGLLDVPGLAEVGRCCLDEVLRRHRLRPPAPVLREELETIFGAEEAAA